jgi:hypothetical protein
VCDTRTTNGPLAAEHGFVQQMSSIPIYPWKQSASEIEQINKINSLFLLSISDSISDFGAISGKYLRFASTIDACSGLSFRSAHIWMFVLRASKDNPTLSENFGHDESTCPRKERDRKTYLLKNAGIMHRAFSPHFADFKYGLSPTKFHTPSLQLTFTRIRLAT